MPTRDNVRQHSKELRDSLLHDCRNGNLRPGDALPPIRELADQNGLSLGTTQRVLKSMADEGILHLRHGSGAFVGRLPEHTECAFASVFGAEMQGSPQRLMTRSAFEAAVSDRGAASLALTAAAPGLEATLCKIHRGEMNIGGVFYFPGPASAEGAPGRDIMRSLAALPRITYVEDRKSCCEQLVAGNTDWVGFDHAKGGRQSVRHLWGRGHLQLAFLALHGPDTPASHFAWSRLRESGFASEVKALGLTRRVFHPKTGPASNDFAEQTRAGHEACLGVIPLLGKGQVSAVVCVNQFTLDGLLRALCEANIPETKWPTMMTFDDEATDNHLLSVIRLPWEDLGRAAALALWERVYGTPKQREAPPREILVPMRLVMRLASGDLFNMSDLTSGAGQQGTKAML